MAVLVQPQPQKPLVIFVRTCVTWPWNPVSEIASSESLNDRVISTDQLPCDIILMSQLEHCTGLASKVPPRPDTPLPYPAQVRPGWRTSHSGVARHGPTERSLTYAHPKPNSAEALFTSAQHGLGQLKASQNCHSTAFLVSIHSTWHLTGYVSRSHCHYLKNQKTS